MKGRHLCEQDHIVNFRHDITEISTRLARLPDRTDITATHKDVDLTRHVDSMVHRGKVKAALQYMQYKIAYVPN
jgi:hypothetical protein